MVVTLLEKLKSGTKVDGFVKVGSRVKDHLTKVKIKVPDLNFSIKDYCVELWGAIWNGRTLPFRFRINGKVIKETFWARVTFATLFIVADSVYLVGRSGVWLINKMSKAKGFNGWNMLMVAGLVVGFLGWVFPWWLETTQFIQDISDTHTMKAIGQVQVMTPVPEVNVGLPSLAWLGVPMLAAVPFSFWRFKKFSGMRWLFKNKPMLQDGE